MEKKDKITPVVEYGVSGYRVVFSIKDLYKLQTLVNLILQHHKDAVCPNPETDLANLIQHICGRCLGTFDVTEWDVLKEEQEAK